MSWKRVGTETVTSQEGSQWEIELFQDKGFPLLRWSTARYRVRATAFKDDSWRFVIQADNVSGAEIREKGNVLIEEARRRIQQGDWEEGSCYQR